jgi:hypothetical protein
MHDIDRTQWELEYAPHEVQPEHYEFEMHEGGYGEFEGEGEYESLAEGESYEGEQFEGEYEYEYEAEMNEAEEMELAAELLEVGSEAELEQFLGKLIRRVGRGLRTAIHSPLGKAIGGVLKPLAKAALPIAGKALGTFVGGPVGGMIGGKLASAAGQMFGLELEGLSGEDREFEVARRYVRFAAATTRNAARAPRNANPRAVAQASAAKAARRHAPGLKFGAPRPRPRTRYNGGPDININFGADTDSDADPDVNADADATIDSALDTGADAPSDEYGRPAAGYGQRGHWVRRGRRIVIFGV